MEPASALHLPCCPWRQRFPDASTCPCTLMSTQHLHCSPFIPRMLRIPAVPAGWVGSGESLPCRVGAGGPRRLSTHEGATSSRGGFLDWALFDVPSALAGCSQVGAHHEFPPALLLFNCSFLLPFSATGRGTSSLSPSRRFYGFGEVGQGEGSSDQTPGRSWTTWAVSPGFISPVAAHVSLPCCLPAWNGLIFSRLAQGLSLCNSLFTSNLVKDRQHASELGLNGAQGFESLTSSWLQLWIWSNREKHAQQTPATFSWSRRNLYVHAFAERLYYAEHAKYQRLSIFRAIVKQKICITEETVGDFSFSPPLRPLVQCLYSVFSSSLCLTGTLVF